MFWGTVPVRDGYVFPKFQKTVFNRKWQYTNLDYQGGYYSQFGIDAKFKKGPKGVRGTLCRCATDADIVKCLRDLSGAKADKNAAWDFKSNCITESVLRLEGCCLEFKERERPWVVGVWEQIIAGQALEKEYGAK